MFQRSLSRFLILLSLVMGHTVFGQECPDLLNPLAGSNNVPVDVVISWEEVIGVTGYVISIGTTPCTGVSGRMVSCFLLTASSL